MITDDKKIITDVSSVPPIDAPETEAIRWLTYAETDVSQGLGRTNAVKKALAMCQNHSNLTPRLEALCAGLARIQAALDTRRDQYAAEKAARQAQKTRRVLYPRSAQPQLRVPVRHRGAVIVYTDVGAKFRIHEDHPSREGSHLLGYEGDWGAYVYYRDATPDEVKALEAREAAQAAHEAEARAQGLLLRAIEDEITTTGDCPAGTQTVEGERLIDTQTISGGGSWYVIAPDYIWYIRNNGADGADWSRNNITTGGAGAIGHRVPYTDELAARLRQLDARISKHTTDL